METNEKQPVDLPENAFRELKPGEEYKPILSPEKVYPEVNAWSMHGQSRGVLSWLLSSRPPQHF